MTSQLKLCHMRRGGGFVSRFLSGALVGLVFLFLSIAARAASLDRAEAIFSQAPDLTTFLAREDLVDQYYAALAEYYGKDRFSRKYFDDILGQLKALTKESPALAKRLWEKTNLGTAFQVEALGSSDSLRLDKNAWEKIYNDWRSTTKTSASKFSHGLNPAQAQEKLRALFAKIETETKQFESELSKSGKDKSARANETAEFWKMIKSRSDVQAAVGYMIESGLGRGPHSQELQSNDPLKILYRLQTTREAPETFLKDSKLPSLIRTALKEAIPNPEDLLSRGVIGSSGSQRASRAALTEVWEFEPLPRRIHGIFKGIPAKECVGGYCEKNEINLMPERWATSAIEDNKVFNVKRAGVYNGFIQVTPVQMESHTYGALDIVSAALSRQVLVSGSDGAVHRISLFEGAYRKLTEQLPKGWSGYVVGDSQGINNAGAKGAVYSNLAYVDGKDLGPRNRASVQDEEMKRVILGRFGQSGEQAESYLNSEPIVEGTVKTTNRVVLLSPPRYEKGEFEDPAWIAKRFQESVKEEVRIFSAFSEREPANDLVRAELKKEAHVIAEALNGHLGEDMGKSAQEFFIHGNEDAMFTFLRYLHEPIRTPSDYFARIKDVEPFFISTARHVLKGTRMYLSSAFEEFLKSGATPADIYKARTLVSGNADINFHIRAIEAGMDRAQSLEDVFNAFTTATQKPAESYQEELSKVFSKRLHDVDRLKTPLTLDNYIQLDEHIASFNQVGPHHEILEKAVSLVKTPSDFLRLLEFRTKDPSDLYKKLIDTFIAKHVQMLGRLTPKITSKQFDQLFKKAESVVAVAAIHRLAVSGSKTPSELFHALEYGVKNPTDEYKKEMKAIVSEALDPLMKLSPSVDDIVKFRKKYVQTKELDTEAVRRGMASVKTARDYFKLIEPAYQESAEDLEKYRGKAIYDTFPQLLEKTRLTSKEYESLLALSPGIKEFYDSKTLKAQSAFSCVFQRMRAWSVRH